MTYVCGSCGHKLKRTSSTMGFCPNCGRDSLLEKQKKQDERDLEKEDELI